MGHGYQKIPAILILILSLLAFPVRAETEETAAGEKQPGTAFVHQENFVYGQQQAAPVFHSDTNDTAPRITYKIQGSSDESYGEEVPTAAGVYTVRVQYPESDTCLAAEAAADFTILASITSISLKLSEGFLAPRTYNGTLQMLEGAEVQFTVEGTSQIPQPGLDYHLQMGLKSPEVDLNPESQNVQAVITMEEGLYAVSPQAETVFSFHVDVLPAPAVIRALDQDAGSGFHNDPALTKIEGILPGQELKSLELSLKEGMILPEKPSILAGNQDVTDQYEILLEPGRYSDQAAIAEYPAAAENLTYNGEYQALLQTPGRGEHGKIFYELRYHASQSREEELLSDWSETPPVGREPGIYRVRFQARGQGFSDSEQQSLVVILMPRPLPIYAEGRKVYDGRKELPEENIRVTVEDDRILPGEEVRVKTIRNSSFQQVGAGNNLKIIPGNVVLEGKDAENYAVKVVSFTGTIERRPVTVKAGDREKAYGQKDPELLYAARGLVGHEQLRGKLQREPGESPGTYAITMGNLTEEQNPNYALEVLPGKLTIHPARAALTLEPSRSRIRPGKTLKLTAKAANGEEGLMQKGWNPPGTLTLVYGQRLLTMEEETPGIWTAEYAVPRAQRGSLRFRAITRDFNYHQAEDEVTVRILALGSNPDTGDQIRFWGTLMFMTALLLTGILIFRWGNHKEK